MPAISNLVHETSTTTGTGSFTLTNVNGKNSFNNAFSTGGTDVFYYFISNQNAAEWEVGTGHMSDATTLVRDTVIASTNSNAAVNFSAGTKDVTNDALASVQTASAMTLASGTSTSGTAVDIDGFFTSAYSYYELKFSQARPSGDAQLSLQVLVASVVDSGTNYRYSGNTATTSPSAAVFGVGGSSEGGVARIELCQSETESSVAHGISGNICIYDPLNTTSHKDFTFAVQNRRDDGFRAADYGGGTYEGATSALSGIRLLWDGGESFQNIKWTLIGYPD